MAREPKICEECEGSGACPDCDQENDPEDCITCEGNGECSDCGGTGEV